MTVACKPENLMHLCGIKKYDKEGHIKGSKRYYEAAVTGQLDMTKVWISDLDLVLDKILALKSMDSLTQYGVRVSGAGCFETHCFDNALRTSKAILAISFILPHKGLKCPNSAINLSLSKANTKVFEDTHRVTRLDIKNTQTNNIETRKFNTNVKKKKNNKKNKKKK